MGRSPCCEQDAGVKKGPWTPEEDKLLVDYIQQHGHGSWRRLPKLAGLNRCGKSCRLRWTNYLRPDIKRGRFTEEEEKLIVHLHSAMGNKWSSIATRLPGRTDNEIKNYWNTHLRKKLLNMGIDPVTHRPRTDLHLNHLAAMAWGDNNNISNIHGALKLQADAARFQLLQGLLRALAAPTSGVDLMGALLAAATTGGLATQSQLAGGVDQLQQQQGATMTRLQYDGGLLNLPALTTVPPVSSPFAGLLNGFGGVLAGDGLSSTTDQQLGHSGASGSNMTAAMAPPSQQLAAAADECNAPPPCDHETQASSPFEGLESLNLQDDLNSDSWKDLLDQMSWFNPNEM